MTAPKLAYKRSGREYRWPGKPPHELAVPSTTTIIGGGVPKEALKFWAAKMAAQYAVEHKGAWERLPKDDAVDLIKRAATRFTERKADLGTAVHAAIEAHLGHRGGPTLNEIEKGYARGALAFLEDHSVEVVRVESTVFSREHGYAGTFDLLYRSPSLPGVIVGDWKTSKAVYDETALQLCASARADFIAEPDGVTEAYLPVEDIDVGTTIRLAADGTYEAVPFLLTDEVFEVFLAAKVVAAREGILRGVRQDALPVGLKEAA